MTSDLRSVTRGSGRESPVVAREQIQKLVDETCRRGRNDPCKPRASECEGDAPQPNDWSGQQVARSQRLHIVTARHLRKARRTIRELRGRVDRLQGRCCEKDLLLAGYRGKIGRENPFGSVPEHYEGDGFVTCDRAIEAASSQACIVERTPIQLWYWATALKYVWRMWSKEDPEKDALKAIDCLEKAAGLGRLAKEEREDG